MSSIYQQNLDEHRALFAGLESLSQPVARAAELMAQVLTAGGKLMFCGNGGSAADSQHLASEFTGRFINDRRPLAGLALSTDTSALTCIANDYRFDEVFDRQVRGLGAAGDCLLAHLHVRQFAQRAARRGGGARAWASHVSACWVATAASSPRCATAPIIVPSRTTARIQEAHILIGHTLCGLIEESLSSA